MGPFKALLNSSYATHTVLATAVFLASRARFCHLLDHDLDLGPDALTLDLSFDMTLALTVGLYFGNRLTLTTYGFSHSIDNICLALSLVP